MLEIRIPNGFADTPKILIEHLEALGVDVQPHHTYRAWNPRTAPTARVCWGICGCGDGLPELNKRAGSLGKLRELRAFHSNDISAPQWWESPPVDESVYPILARDSNHYLGKDIKLCKTPRDAARVSASYFTKLIPNYEEFRVWVFQNKCLGVYRVENKVDASQTLFPSGPGWTYTRLYEEEGDTIPERVIELAKAAIAAVHYDFGAVDILHGLDHRYYVLEVNSAPGVETNRQYALILLARQIAKWFKEI